jgi:NitT/TauT family transport system substrate-binding protein
MQKFYLIRLFIVGLMATLIVSACNKSEPESLPTNTDPSVTKVAEIPSSVTPTSAVAEVATPSFSFAWSEYPSWSALGYACEVGLVNCKKGGELSALEKKWNVDLEFKQLDYDSCMSSYASGAVDASALTNIDSLSPAQGKKTVAIFPTSTSDKADALIVKSSIKSWNDLKGKSIYGLENSVSQYVFDRIAETAGQNINDFTFSNKDPGAAALAMQQENPDFNAIIVWNPFTLETLRKLGDKVHVLGDSGAIPLEVIDLVVMSQDALDRPGGDRAAAALADAFYEINKRIKDPKTRPSTLTGISEKFAPLSVPDMEIVVQQTKFFGTADEGIDLFANPKLREIEKPVTAFAVRHGVKNPMVGYGTKADAPTAQFRFDSTYIWLAKNGPKK